MSKIFEEIPLDLKLIIVYLALTVFFIMIPPLNETIVRTILGIPMVLFIPGYILITALFPGKEDLDGIERLALSFGLSIAVVPLIGLGLNFTPWGIRLVPVLAALVLVSISLLMIANFRRLKLSPEERFEIPLKASIIFMKKEFSRPHCRVDKILTIILVLSIVVSLVALVYVIIIPIHGEKFTEFYILGPDGKASDYPRDVRQSIPINLIIGIVNHEYSEINYTLQIQVKNETILERKMLLSNNQTWEKPVSFAMNTTGSNLKLEFFLYREGLDDPYRETHLWVNSTA